MTLDRPPLGGRPTRTRPPASATALAAFVVLACSLALLAPDVRAGPEILRESYAPATWDNSFANVWVNQPVAQSFLARTSFLLTRVELYVFDQPEVQAPDILQVFIAQDAGNRPGTVLASTARQGQQNWTWVPFSYYPWVSLTAGQKYWIVAEDAEPRPKGYEWAMNAVGGYATGEAQWYDSSASTWTNGTGADLFFKVFGISGPSIVLEMEPGLWPADPGTVFPIALSFNNSGNDLASNVRLDVDLDAGLTYVADDASASGGIVVGTLAWAFADVAPGPHRMTVWVRLEPDPEYFDGQSLSAWGFLNYTDASGAPQAPSLDVTTVTVLVPVVRGVATPNPANVAPGETLNITVSFYNLGSGRAAWLWANATGVARLTILGDDAATAGGTLVGPNAWRFENVTSQAYVFNVTVRADIAAWPGDRLVLRVNLTYTDGAGRLFESRTVWGSAAIHGPSLLVEGLTPSAEVHPEQVLSVTFHFNNTGDEAAGRAWLNVTLPTDTLFLDSSLPGMRSGNRVEYALTDVAAGVHSVTIRVRVAGAASPGARLDSLATLDVANASGSLLRPSTASVVSIVRTPRFTLDVTASANRVAPGDVIDVELAWNNSGNEAARTVWINFSLPDKTLLVNSSRPWSSTSGATYGWRLADVGSGADRVSLRLEGSARLEEGEALVAVATLVYERADGVIVAAANASMNFEGLVGGPTSGLEFVFLWVAILVSVFLLFLLLGYWDVLPRRRAVVDDVFLLHNSGILICHYSTTLRPDVDSDIASGMLMAVRNFVADALRTKNGALEEMKYGDHRIHMAHGVHSILVVFARGRSGRSFETRMAEVLRNIEIAYAGVLESWSGRTEEFKGVEEHLLRLLNA
ncbi:MAG: hypothetical protein ACT4OI_05805 [Methanobacteriota archaeon]